MSHDNTKSGSRTLLMSVLMSAPGPLVVGLGLLSGRSSTQIADFVRRSAELLAIIMSFVVYRITAGNSACSAQQRLQQRVFGQLIAKTHGLAHGGMAQRQGGQVADHAVRLPRRPGEQLDLHARILCGSGFVQMNGQRLQMLLRFQQALRVAVLQRACAALRPRGAGEGKE